MFCFLFFSFFSCIFSVLLTVLFYFLHIVLYMTDLMGHHFADERDSMMGIATFRLANDFFLSEFN